MMPPFTRILLPAAFASALAVLASCETAQSVNPFATSSPYRTHCRAALDQLVSRDADRARVSIEDVNERQRDTAMAVTIVYVQGEARRLFTCLYQPERPNRLVGGSYRGQTLTPAQLDDVNANAGRR